MEVEATTEADMFDVALEKVAKGRRGTTGGGITTSARRRIKNTTLAVGRSLPKTPIPNPPVTFPASRIRRTRLNSPEFKKRKPAMGLGKSKRAGGGGCGGRRRQIGNGWTDGQMDRWVINCTASRLADLELQKFEWNRIVSPIIGTITERLKPSPNRPSPTLYENPILQTQIPHNQLESRGEHYCAGGKKAADKPREQEHNK